MSVVPHAAMFYFKCCMKPWQVVRRVAVVKEFVYDAASQDVDAHMSFLCGIVVVFCRRARV